MHIKVQCGVVLCGFLNIEPQTTQHYAVRFFHLQLWCGVATHFMGNFGQFRCGYVVQMIFMNTLTWSLRDIGYILVKGIENRRKYRKMEE